MHPLQSGARLSDVLRLLALGLVLILGLEWSEPLVALAQPNGTPSIATTNNELPPIQEVENVEVRSPFYKKWWFWTIVAAVAGGAAIAVAAGGSSGNGGGAPAPASPGGNVNVKW